MKNGKYLKLIKYSELSYIILACDNQKNVRQDNDNSQKYSSSNQLHISYGEKNFEKPRHKITPQVLASLKEKSTFDRCGEIENWGYEKDRCKGPKNVKGAS